MIRVFLGIPEAFVARAEHVFEVFAQHWGVPLSVSRDPAADAHVAYQTDDHERRHGVVRIRFDERLYDAGCGCVAREHDGHQVWCRPDVDPDAADIVGASHRLLTFLDEQRVRPEDRDRRGIFRTDALPPARRRVVDVPVVDHHAAWLLERLVRTCPRAVDGRLAKWPDGNRYALAVTHDTDAITLGAVPELATNLAKSVIGRDRTYAQMFVDGLRYLGDPMGNPLFGFPRWRDFERARHVRSEFYLYARLGSVKRDIHDCKSSIVEQRIDWRVLTGMLADGWDFGFHAPINSRSSADAFATAKQWLEERLGGPVHGVRHHYWALDWRSPHKTLRMHAETGFRYDGSIAWRDVSGFRAATCHPFRPFDPEAGEVLDLYELPVCLMDGHVIRDGVSVSGAVDAALRMIRRVRDLGGVAVLDWHAESACADYVFKRHVATLDGVLAAVADDGDAWIATPREIVQHWDRRAAALRDG
ncbi:MAG: hypothetical protein QOD81_779 [Solirubrobacteraceae bacterium]|nr:hypothetical protein [Solirubrobacteraceae bacterium]